MNMLAVEQPRRPQRLPGRFNRGRGRGRGRRSQAPRALGDGQGRSKRKTPEPELPALPGQRGTVLEFEGCSESRPCCRAGFRFRGFARMKVQGEGSGL